MAQFFEFAANGIRFTGFQNIRQALKDAWETTFGVQLDDSPTSPDGHHIDLETKTINSVLEAVQVVTTMLNRNQAKGVFLDYQASFLGIDRNEDETDDELRARMNSADTSGMATYDGMLTYLRDQIHSSVNLLQNEEPETNEDGIPGHQFRVVIPQAVYDALVEKEESEEIASADNYIAQKVWNCKPAGIKADGNKTGIAVDIAGLNHDVKFSLPQDVEVEISVALTLYDEESFPTGGEQAVAALDVAVTRGEAEAVLHPLDGLVAVVEVLASGSDGDDEVVGPSRRYDGVYDGRDVRALVHVVGLLMKQFLYDVRECLRERLTHF